MSTAIQKAAPTPIAISLDALTAEQRMVIRNTCAPKEVTEDEFRLFLHVASVSGLDPLRRQIHCMKLSGRLTIVADINGLQARAARESDYEGIAHAVVYANDDFSFNQKTGEVVKHESNPFKAGAPIGAWAIVRRKGMLPFVSLVRFTEYDNPNNPLWKTKPGVMIDKCAKSSALRLAYPEQLGNVYEEAELGKEERELNPPPDDDPKRSTVETLKQELAARSTGPTVAPVAPAPSVAIVDVAAGESEEQATARAAQAPPTNWGKIVELGALYGKTEEEMKSFCREWLKGRKKVSPEDVRIIQDALSRVTQPIAANEPPPPTDADAPSFPGVE